MKYFIDTEFIEGFHKPFLGKKRHFIDLISIGIVSEDGRTYYAISNEFNPKDADEWVKLNVISALPPKIVSIYDSPRVKGESLLWKSNKQIIKEIVEFTNPDKFLHNNSEPKLEFYGYYADYDWVLLCSLFGKMINLPDSFPMYCKDLKQLLDEKANSLTSSELSKLAHTEIVTHNVFSTYDSGVLKCSKTDLLKSAILYPKQNNEHNALDDAKWNFELYKFLQTI